MRKLVLTNFQSPGDIVILTAAAPLGQAEPTAVLAMAG
jgi:hypothetical protein